VVMLRGGIPSALLLGGLAGLGVLFAVASYLLFQRELKRG